MQVPARKEASGVSYPAPGDANVKAMSMGSWRAKATKYAGKKEKNK